MKWADLAKMLAPVLGIVIPGAAPLIPFIVNGISEAQQLPDASSADKKAHVLNLVVFGAQGANATGKVAIDPAQAVAITESVFSSIDHVNSILSANPPTPAPAPANAGGPLGG